MLITKGKRLSEGFYRGAELRKLYYSTEEHNVWHKVLNQIQIQNQTKSISNLSTSPLVSLREAIKKLKN